MTGANTTVDHLADRHREASKAPGSPYWVSNCFGTMTMSCFICGKHRVRSKLVYRKLVGRPQVVCAPSCRALDQGLDAAPGHA